MRGTEKLYIHGLVREMVWDSLNPDLEQFYRTIEGILATEKQFAEQYSLEDYEDAWDVAACQPQIRKLLLRNTQYFEIYFYLMLFEILAMRVCYQSVKRLYEAKTVSSDTQREAYLLQMRKEQLDDLNQQLLPREQQYEWAIREGARLLNCINVHYNELHRQAKEE